MGNIQVVTIYRGRHYHMVVSSPSSLSNDLNDVNSDFDVRITNDSREDEMEENLAGLGRC